MNITPLDIRKQTFGKSFRGFNREEVETFLEMVAEAFEQLNQARASLESKTRDLESAVEKYEHLEQTLQDTLITAQRVADEAKENARKEAQLIVKDAELRADRLLEEARQGASDMKHEILTLRTERDAFIVRLTAQCKSQLELLQVFTEQKQEARAEPTIEEAPTPPVGATEAAPEEAPEEGEIPADQEDVPAEEGSEEEVVPSQEAEE